ncbi:Polyprotein [Phytophthora palmivora]|uniref:Polyprotein n=1 Tax=Phytophthora palmivora TaxID=4796 RepID=A0A2P4XDR2_9STRA|nr:Polyprotein [Phytophthora palmivora]
MKLTIHEWTNEILNAGNIRPIKISLRFPHILREEGNRVVTQERKHLRRNAQWQGFSAIDLLWDFLQVRLCARDIPYKVFIAPDGFFENLITPMGLSCSPVAFNRLIQRGFADQSSFGKAYLNDLLVYTTTAAMEDHLVALEQVLEMCKAGIPYVNLSKCTFCASEIPCLSDFIGVEGIRIDLDKWSTPLIKQNLQQFLGTCVYVLKYCPNFAELAALLSELRK